MMPEDQVNELANLLVRWVQAQVVRHQVHGERVSNLEKESVEALRILGYVDENGAWTLP
jgi:copper oxidase (laccase) domain-containing protein